MDVLSMRRSLRPALILFGAVLAVLLILVGCGGGVFIGSSDGTDGSSPSVTLATAASSASAGQSVRFVAAAADVNGIDSVSFYRVDVNGDALVSTDTDAPYEAMISVPTDGRTTLSVFARATDPAGNFTDSTVVVLPVAP